ncbi:MFS transporter [Nocardia rhamnosiphila]
MDKPAKRGFHVKLMIACCGGPFLDGYVMSIIGVALIGISEQLNPSSMEMGLIGATSLVGIFVGATVFGFLTDRIGREKMYALDLTVLVVACAMSVFVQEAWQLIILRFIIGAAIGADYPIATSLLTEYTPTRKRGFMVGMSSIAWSIGATAAYVVGALFVGISGGNDQWRWLLATSAILGIIVVIIRRGIPESPRWLLKNNRVAEAEDVFEQIYGARVDLSKVTVDDEESSGKVSLRVFLKPVYLRRIIMCCILYLAVVTPVYALLTFLPSLLKGFNVSGGGASGMLVEIVIIAMIAIGGLPGLWLVERWGRRPLAIIPMGLMILPLAALWLWAGGPIWFVALMFCSYTFISGGPNLLVWIYPNELFPTEVRATAVGISVAVSRFGAATGTYLLPLSLSSLGTGTTMLFGAALTAIAFVVCIAWAPETKGMSLEQAAATHPEPAPQRAVAVD